MEKDGLTVGEMPSHNHSGSTNTAGNHNHGIYAQAGNGADPYISYYESVRNGKTFYTNNGGSHSHSITINNTGSNQAHNNMQPYLAVYMWKRVA